MFVIGAGSGGVRFSRMAAQRGLRVVVAEAGPLGGTCVNVGCIPKKLYSNAAHYGESIEEAVGYGWERVEPHFDWAVLRANRAREITRLNGIYGNLMTGAGVDVVPGRAHIVAPATVAVGARTWHAARIVVATGARPATLEIPGGAHAVSSDAMFDLPVFPKRLVVIGGGYIASEFASIFNGLGSAVTQVHRGEQILRGFDDDVRQAVAGEMARKGVVIRTGVRPASIEKRADGSLLLQLDDGRTLDADVVLNATGRVPNVQGLGLEAIGVAMAPNGAVTVDANYETNVPGVHAIGDVINRVQLTPVALAEAMALVEVVTGGTPRSLDYALIPTAVFTHPNIGTVGLSEAVAREIFGHVRIFRSSFTPLRHTLTGTGERSFMKLVVDADSDRVVGLHLVGADAGEIVQGFAVAMKAGATKAVFDATLGIHPTVAEEFVTLRTPSA